MLKPTGDVRDVSHAGQYEEDGLDAVGGEDKEEHPARLAMVDHGGSFVQVLCKDEGLRI